MSNTIQMKYSTTADAVPTSDLATGELGININDRKIWFGDNAGTPQATTFNISSFNNDANYTTNTGTTTASNAQTFTNKQGNITQWNSGTLSVARGGTGASSLTDKAVLISQDSGTDAVGSVALTTSGQLIVGGSSGPAAATLTASTGISVTNGDGSITIASDIEGTEIKSTTNSNEAATKYLRADGDGTCSWQTVSGGGSFDDFTVAGDSGSSQTISDGNTLTIAGGTGLASVASATDTLTLNIDSTVATLTGGQTLTNKELTSPDINTPDIDGGTIDGATIATSDVTVGSSKTLDVSSGTLTTSAAQKAAIVAGVGANVDIGDYAFRAQNLVADSLSDGKVIFAIATGQLSTDSNFSFNNSTDTLTVSKIGAFTAAGAIDFDDQNMTNVDIDSGTITGITDLAVADGGTGAGTFTSGGLLYGNGTSAIGATSALTNGQLLIGDGSGAPSLATLTAGTGISVSNGAGSITIASTVSDTNTNQLTTFTLAGDSGSSTIAHGNTLTVAGTAPISTAASSDTVTVSLDSGGALSNLGGGSGSTFLRKDGTWATPTDTDTNTNQLTTFTLTGDSGSNQTIAHGNTMDIAGGDAITTVVGSTDTVTINHDDTSSQASVNNSGTTAIQDITLDTYGHVTGITSADVGGGGGSGTTINNNADNYVITGSGTANTLEAEGTFTFDGTDAALTSRSAYITLGSSHPAAAPAYKLYDGADLKTGTHQDISVATAWMYDAVAGAVVEIASTTVNVSGGIIVGYT